MKTLNFYEDDNYKVTYAPGKAKVVVIAFAGVQKGLNGIEIEEFKKSLFNRCHVFFIVDKKNSWWNNGNIFYALDLIFNEFNQEENYCFSVIGNSMGGSGALLACNYYEELTRGIAVVPQADIKYPNTYENRWQEWRSSINFFRFQHYALKPCNAELCVFFGSDADTYQKSLFKSEGIPITEIPVCDHNVIRYFKNQYRHIYKKLIDYVVFEEDVNTLLSATSNVAGSKV